MTNKNVVNRLKENIKEIDEKMDYLKTLLDDAHDNIDFDSVTWADVGDVVEIKNHLDEIIDFILGND